MSKNTAQPALQSMLLISDAHRPYHDKRAWNLVLQVGRWLKPHTIVSNGDFADFYAVSSHSKDPNRAGRLKEEVADARKGLAELEALGATRKIFVEGNHCDRLRRYLEEKAPELFGLIDIPELFELKKHGWQHVPYKADIRLGKLYITHDVGTAGRYASYKALDTYQHSVITGHTHRLSYVVEGNAVGEFKLSAMFGWLGDRSKVDYMHRVNVAKNWPLGFGVGYLHPRTGVAYLTPVPIVNYSCVVNGRYFEA